MIVLRRMLIPALALALITAACGGDEQTNNGDGLTVIVTTTILGDIASRVVGDSGTVTSLLPIGVDPHDYQASAQQAAAIAEADIVIANGLGLEEGLSDLLESAASDGANVVEIGPLIEPIPFADEDHDEHEHEGDDPHFWLDPLRDAEAARTIAVELAAIDPSVDWADRADTYAEELVSIDAQIAEILQVVPEARRKLVTNHHAFGYFAQRYGFEMIGAVVPGGSTLAAPSSAELTELAEQIRTEGVPALFTETTESETLAEALAAEVGEQVTVVQLYTGSLGEPGSGADTLIGMLLTNGELIAEALR